MNKIFEAVIFVGIQGSGKSSFYKEKFFKTHIRINLDMLRTRNREKNLLEYCIENRQSFVIDNTNPSAEDRKKYIERIPKGVFSITAYYFDSSIEEAKERNNLRAGDERIPVVAIMATSKKIEIPTYEEGFDKIVYVKLDNQTGFSEGVVKDETKGV